MDNKIILLMPSEVKLEIAKRAKALRLLKNLQMSLIIENNLKFHIVSILFTDNNESSCRKPDCAYM